MFNPFISHTKKLRPRRSDKSVTDLTLELISTGGQVIVGHVVKSRPCSITQMWVKFSSWPLNQLGSQQEAAYGVFTEESLIKQLHIRA